MLKDRSEYQKQYRLTHKEHLLALTTAWQKNGWRNSKREPVKNDDLWKKLLTLTQKHKVTWEWVKAHDDNIGNEISNKKWG